VAKPSDPERAPPSPDFSTACSAASVKLHLHLVSDATGETVVAMGRAAASQFEDLEIVEHVWTLVRSPAQVDRVLRIVARHPGVVLFTLAIRALRDKLEDGCRALGVPCLPILDPVLAALSAHLGAESKERPGQQHSLDAGYFSRIDALNFALSHDDGNGTWDLEGADVVLVGVSRTSKTPTCVYLAYRGIKAANIPLVPGCPPPAALETLRRPLVIGLTLSPERLVQVRRNRLQLLDPRSATGEVDYVDLDKVKREVALARRLFSAHDWPVIDVTRRSVEETAAAILQLLARRRDEAGGFEEDVFGP
jgi:[pyruvate, water dikinase]-phosphate phosphotransferase / [pyruvate, water dikinase] kinase